MLYGGNNNWFAAYAYWYFKLYGHDKVLLLDGGRKKWELDARELSSETVTRPATSYTATEPNLNIRAFRDEVVARSVPRAWSMYAAQMSTLAGCSPPPTCRRSRPSAAVTFPPR